MAVIYDDISDFIINNGTNGSVSHTGAVGANVAIAFVMSAVQTRTVSTIKFGGTDMT